MALRLSVTRTSQFNNDDESEDLELHCVSSLYAKLPAGNSLVFNYCTLEDALNTITSSNLNERKMLLLYFHSSTSPFSKLFLKHLKVQDEMSRVLRRAYLVVGWDLDNPSYHEHLVNVLNSHPVLSSISEFVSKQVAAAFCIFPYDTSIQLASCLRQSRMVDLVESLKGLEKLHAEHLRAEKEEKEMEAQTGSENDIGPEKMQRIWAEMLGDRDYDSFEYNEHEALKDKIGFALNGPPVKEDGYNQKQLNEIEKLYKKISMISSKFAECKGRVEIAVFYACLVPLVEEKIAKMKKDPKYKPVTDWCPLPVFLLRKCRKTVKTDHNERLPCCVIIDHTGRVYQTWTSYLLDNKYAEGHIIVPKDGRYRNSGEGLLLESHLSPACHIAHKLLFAGDVTGIVASLGSAAIGVGAAIPAVAALPVLVPPVLIGAAVTGGIAVLWTLGRTIHNLVDRSQHDEELSIANSEARGAYLNIVACSLGFVGAGASLVLTQLVANGINVGKGAVFAFNSVSVLNLGANGASMVNSAYDMVERLINEKKLPSALAVLQLSASVLFFAHAAANFKGAQTVIDETQARTLQNYQTLLGSNRLKKMFNKLLKESIRVHGDETKGMAEVILTLRKIPKKSDVFAALNRNNKLFNKQGVKFAARNGDIIFNGIKVDMDQFIGLSRKQTENFLVNLGQDSVVAPTSNPSTSLSLRSAVSDVFSALSIDVSGIDLPAVVGFTMKIISFLNEDVRVQIIEAVRQGLAYYLSKYGKALIDQVNKILPEKNSQYTHLVNVVISYFRKEVDRLEEQYQNYLKTGDQRYYSPIFTKINPEYLKRIVKFFEWIVKNSFSAETLILAVAEKIAVFISSWIAGVIFDEAERDAKDKAVEEHSNGYEVSEECCQVCGGHYFKPV